MISSCRLLRSKLYTNYLEKYERYQNIFHKNNFTVGKISNSSAEQSEYIKTSSSKVDITAYFWPD
jgi:archaellum component FlaF (FlaF/FlaG flagellin family)